jgi:hypothetical protein
MARIVYKEIASILIAISNCARNMPHTEGAPTIWAQIWPNVLDDIIKEYLPSGSGIDNGTKLDIEKSNRDRLVFNIAFHCMDSNGYYAGWRDYVLTVKPSLPFDIDLKITGRDYNGLKDYLYEIYQYALNREIPEAEYSAIIARYHSLG